MARTLRQLVEEDASVLNDRAGYEASGADPEHTSAEAVLSCTAVLVDPAHADERGEHAMDAGGRELDSLSELSNAHRVRVLGQGGDDTGGALHRANVTAASDRGVFLGSRRHYLRACHK